MNRSSFLVLLSLASCAQALPQSLHIVNGQSEVEQKAEDQQQQLPFVVVAANNDNDETAEKSLDEGNDEGTVIPTKGQSLFKLLSREDQAREDIQVIRGEDNEGEEDHSLVPTNESGQQTLFKQLAKRRKQAEDAEDSEAVVVEANEDQPLLKDIPRDNSGRNEAGFRLPTAQGGNLPSASGRAQPGSPQLPSSGDGDDDVVVVEAGDDEPSNWSDIPRDNSGFKQAGFRLPLPDETEEDEYSDVEVTEAERNSERLPKKIADEASGLSSIDPDQPDCNAPKDAGNCQNSVNYFYYEPKDNACHAFEYTGCGGNTNRFLAEFDCIKKCKDPSIPDPVKPKKIVENNTTTTTTTSTTTPQSSTNTSTVCPTSAPICEDGCSLKKEDNNEGACLLCDCDKKEEDVSRCLEAPKTGLCKANLKYWYYNADRQACEEFTYGGCETGSSPNKFRTEALCEAACSGVTRPA